MSDPSFDFEAAVSAPFRMQPGLRRLAEGAAQLTTNVAPERGTACHLREKLAVLQAFPTQALLSRDAFDARPALDALARHAAQEHPQAFALDTMQWRAPILGWDVDQAGGVHELAPDRTPWPEAGECLLALPARWRRAALLSLAFAEDFAIIDGNDGTIPWLAVALPSHWAPEQKVGRSFAEVHAPVADNRLITGQSFIPVDGQQQAVFAIHVEVQPLAQALADPGRAARVHDALATMSPAVLHYRGLATVRDRLLRWLAVR